MTKDDKIYRKLQKHLNRQPVGFPRTLSGADIRVLKHLFTTEEARVATGLDFRFQSLDAVMENLAGTGPPENLKGILERMAGKGVIGYRRRDGVDFYCNMPLVVGMYEGFNKHLSPEFIADFNRYTSSPAFGVSFLGTAVPQMRTIPVEESIPPDEHPAADFDQVAALLSASPGPFAVLECICRKKKAMEGSDCRVTHRKETCMAAGDTAAMVLRHDMGRELSKQEALDLLRQNTREGLVLQPSNTQEIEFVCSCCGCCCGMLNIQKLVPRPLDFWAANYFAVLDTAKCTQCGICARKCQVDAIAVKKKDKKIVEITVNAKKCIGCGNCVVACKFDAISLKKKETEAVPPKDIDELADVLMTRKKGTWAKVRMVARMILGLPQ